MTWQPILDGAVADEAWQAVHDIARAIDSRAGSRRQPTDLTLFWAYIASAIDEQWTSLAYDSATQELCETLLAGYGWPGLHGGLAGAGWALAHVSDEEVADAPLAVIDQAIIERLAVERWTDDYDLIGGLVGIGVYCLERLAQREVATARQCLTRVIDHLAATAEVGPDGVTWFTAPELVPPLQKASAPGGYYNLGLAHGVPGVVAFLGRVAALPRPDPRAANLCNEARRWLAAQASEVTDGARYDAWCVRGGRPVRSTRAAWCYGDPGVAVAATGAASRCQQPTDEWLALARLAAARPFEQCGVNDAGLCHGTAGLAHINNRLYQMTREPVFRDASRTWFERTLGARRPDGIGGFAAWTAIYPSTEIRWEPAADLVEGAVGIGLALLAAVQPVEPSWDRVFACDLPVA